MLGTNVTYFRRKVIDRTREIHSLNYIELFVEAADVSGFYGTLALAFFI
jgi:hypothetical protein